MIELFLLMASAPQWNCEDPGPQQEMNYCAHQDYLAADRALNAQWNKASAAMKQRDAEGYGMDDGKPDYFDALLEAQRAWLKYRDAHCRTEGYHFRGGSMEPFMVSTCKRALTEERTKQLASLIEVDG